MRANRLLTPPNCFGGESGLRLKAAALSGGEGIVGVQIGLDVLFVLRFTDQSQRPQRLVDLLEFGLDVAKGLAFCDGPADAHHELADSPTEWR